LTKHGQFYSGTYLDQMKLPLNLSNDYTPGLRCIIDKI